MAWTNFAIDFPTCECSNESYWSNLIAQSWTQWANFSSYLGTANPLAYSELNTTHWIWGDTTCGCKFTYTNDYNAAFTFYYNNEIYLNMTCEPGRLNSSGNALYLYAGVDESNQYGSCFLMYKSGNQCINRNLGYSKTNWQNPMYQIIKAGSLVIPITSNGGGATHIAKRAGLLSSIGASNLSDILMVSGGGGGGLLVGDTDYSGKEAGGISGSGDNSADQSTGNAFGQGESGTGVSGGGGGLYGGYKGTSSKSGGAGSGYIGNALVSNKKMVGYNVPISSAESTKTESINEASESPVSGKPKIGNGYARIKLVSQEQEYDIDSLLKNKNLSDSSQYSIVYAEGYSAGIGNRIPNFVGTNTILGCSTVSASNFTLPNYSNGLFDLTAMTNQGYGYICIPIKPMYVSKVSFEYKIFGSGFNNEDFKVLLCSDDGSSISHYDMRIAPPLNPTDWTSMEYTFTSSEFVKLYTYLTIQRNSMQVQVRNLKIDGTLKP